MIIITMFLSVRTNGKKSKQHEESCLKLQSSSLEMCLVMKNSWMNRKILRFSIVISWCLKFRKRRKLKNENIRWELRQTLKYFTFKLINSPNSYFLRRNWFKDSKKWNTLISKKQSPKLRTKSDILKLNTIQYFHPQRTNFGSRKQS